MMCMNKIIILLTMLIIACTDETIKRTTESKPVYSLPSRDPGDYQSPINIFSFNTKKTQNTNTFDIHFEDKITEVENLGHTVQLDFKQGSIITINEIHYNFKQMHFHTPSEHLIDGVTYPMELHIVTVNNDNPNVAHYIVFSILFKMGKENAFIDEFLNIIPKHEHDKVFVKENTIKLKDLLSASDITHHYHYKGSLTTPPYTETVNWFVLKRVFEASPEQIEKINAIEGNNARHIESNNNRLIETN